MTDFLFFILLFLTTIFLSKFIIPKLRLIHINERIEKSCIAKLHKDKIGTPTMGDIIMIMSLLIFLLLYYLIYKIFLVQILVIICFGFLGIIDDMMKLKQIRKDGLSYKQKIMGQVILSIIVILYLRNNIHDYNSTYIPFFNSYLTINTKLYDLLVIVFILSVTNSTNITDGLDGLSSGIAIIIFVFFYIISSICNNYNIEILSLIFVSITSGFLFFNKYPAKIFMGNTGALLIGGAFSVISLSLKIPLILLIIAGICVFETLSVIIQLTSKKYFNKSVFKIAPYHHHLQKCDFKEKSIVYMFWIITIILCIIGFYSIGGIQ